MEQVTTKYLIFSSQFCWKDPKPIAVLSAREISVYSVQKQTEKLPSLQVTGYHHITIKDFTGPNRNTGTRKYSKAKSVTLPMSKRNTTGQTSGHKT